MNIDGEKLSGLRFADDVAPTTDVKDMECQLNTVNEERLKLGFMKHKGKPKFMMNIGTTDNMQIDWTEIVRVINYKYLGQTIAMGNRTRQEALMRIKAG